MAVAVSAVFLPVFLRISILFQGLIYLWDVEGGLSVVDKYLYSTDNNVVAGALLAVGIINCGVHNECDPVSMPVSQVFSCLKS